MSFHQSRWGYKYLDMIKDVLEGYEKYDIPLDAIWLDIYYMVEYMQWTIDSVDIIWKILKIFWKSLTKSL